MRSVFVMLTAVVLWSTAAMSIAAQETTPAAPLSLQQVLDIALKNQIDIRVAENNVEASKQRVTQARSEYFPQVSIDNNAFSIGGNGVLTERRTGTAVVASQNIFDGGIRESRVAGARYGADGSRAGYARTVQVVTFEVTTAYYELLRAKHLADVAQADVRYNEALRETIQSRVEVGDAAQVDVLPVESELANARVNLIAAQNRTRIANTQLQNAIGLSPQPGFDIQDVGAEPDVQLKPMETYISEAIKSRPDILQAQAGVGAAGAAVKSSRISLYPRPVITGEYQKGLGGLSGESAQIFGGITFDVFNGGRNRAVYKEALAERSTAVEQSEQVSKDIQAQVQGAYYNLNDSRERLGASRVGLEAAQRNYEVQQARYQTDLAVPLDLLDAERQVITAQTNMVEARYDLLISLAQMNFAVGKVGGFNAD